MTTTSDLDNFAFPFLKTKNGLCYSPPSSGNADGKRLILKDLVDKCQALDPVTFYTRLKELEGDDVEQIAVNQEATEEDLAFSKEYKKLTDNLRTNFKAVMRDSSFVLMLVKRHDCCIQDIVTTMYSTYGFHLFDSQYINSSLKKIISSYDQRLQAYI